MSNDILEWMGPHRMIRIAKGRVGRGALGSALVVCLALVSGCASVDDFGGSQSTDLGESKQEFEVSARGGRYRFEYVTQGTNGYRTVFWRQGTSLSDDGKDAKLATNAVRHAFKTKFCKDLKLPVTFADGSPAPVGNAGLWTATLKCAKPPPKPKKPKPVKKKKQKKKKPSSDVVASKKKKSSSSSSSSSSTVKKKASSYDGPMVCKSTGSGYSCKPKR